VDVLASFVTSDPVKIVVGGGTANQDIQQVVMIMEDEEAKFMWALQNLDRLVSGKIFNFCEFSRSRKGVFG
jgi:hypothetical protein